VTLQKLPDWASGLLGNERVGRLAFADDRGHPRVLPVTFAVAEDAVWSAIDQKPKRRPEPARVRWLRRRPEAALCLDLYSDDWSQLAWLQLLCRVEVLERDAAGPGLAALAAKYGQYADQPPPGPVLRLAPVRALHWRAADYPG